MINTGPAQIIQFAIEATIYASPYDEGLNYKELVEVSSRFGFQEGEINDALNNLQRMGDVEAFFRDERFYLKKDYVYFIVPYFRFNPEIRDLKVMDFIVNELIQEVKSRGSYKFSMAIPGLIERTIAANPASSEKIVRASIRLLELAKLFTVSKDKNYILEPKTTMIHPEFVKNIYSSSTTRNDPAKFSQTLAHVEHIIANRSTGRPVSSDPLKAFGELLPRLGSERFVSWWNTTALELKGLDYQRNPASVLLMSAALCEGALSFLIMFTKDHEAKMVKTLDLDVPRNWKFSGLIKAASSGVNPLIKEEKMRFALESLNEHRQRIHPASYFLEQGKVPDLRPEEAKTAITTTELLLRSIMDWIVSNKIL